MMWGFGFGWIWMVVFWAAVIGAIVWAATRVSPTTRDRGGSVDDPRSILEARYARGEIDTVAYRQLRDELLR